MSLEIVLSEDRVAGRPAFLDRAHPVLFAEFVRGSDVSGERRLMYKIPAAKRAIVALSASVAIVVRIHGRFGRTCSKLLRPDFGPGMSWVNDGGVRRVEVGIA